MNPLYKGTCAKCGGALFFRLDGGAVTDYDDTVLRCPVCSKRMRVYHPEYRDEGCERYAYRTATAR